MEQKQRFLTKVFGVMAIAIDGKESTKWKMIEVYETFGCYGSSFFVKHGLLKFYTNILRE